MARRRKRWRIPPDRMRLLEALIELSAAEASYRTLTLRISAEYVGIAAWLKEKEMGRVPSGIRPESAETRTLAALYIADLIEKNIGAWIERAECEDGYTLDEAAD